MTSSAWSGRTARPTEVSTCRSRPSRSNGLEKTRVDALREHLGVGRPSAIDGQQDRELVAAEAGHGVRLAHDVAQPVGDLDEQLVAAGVAEGVVDLLEAVDVEQHEADRVAGARRCAAAARSSRSLSRRRLGRPVSGSSRASRAVSEACWRRVLEVRHTVRNSSSHSTPSPATTTRATTRTDCATRASVAE